MNRREFLGGLLALCGVPLALSSVPATAEQIPMDAETERGWRFLSSPEFKAILKRLKERVESNDLVE